MKVVFAGTPEFAVPILGNLAKQKDVQIEAVITQPDKPVGRKGEITPPPVKKLAGELNLPVFQPENKKELEEILKKMNFDFLVVVAYGMILTKNILALPKIAPINIHCSLLPKYRGASPMQEALLNGDTVTGISIMKIAPKLDSGDIYLLKRVAIDESDNLPSLSQKLALIAAEILPQALRDITNGSLKGIPQDESKAIYCHKITKEDGKINWNKTAAEIINMLRAYTPWPEIHTEIAGKKLKIIEAKIKEGNLVPGKFEIVNNELLIGTKQGILVPQKVQIEGKSLMDIRSFLNGYKTWIEKL